MSKYTLGPRSNGKWVLVLNETAQAVLVFETRARADDFIANVPEAARNEIDASALRSLDAPLHVMPSRHMQRTNCPACGASFNVEVQVAVIEAASEPSADQHPPPTLAGAG